ncbi:MAG TPA: VanZ family protein [Polyangiaceae bacterium]|jgi:VanZ family protein
MNWVWWRERHWIALGAYVAVVFVTVPFTRRVVLALRNTDLLGATVTGSYAIAVAGVVYYVLFNRRLADWVAFAVVAALLCVVTVLLLGLAIPEERVHFLQYGSMALLARSALARGTEGHAARSLALGVALTSTLGLLEECLQGLVPWRVFDWRDVAMDAGAALITLLLDELLHDRLRLRQRAEKSGGAG